ncbi:MULTISPECIES: hypothetical protein [Pseudomonas]|uniref:hypothetical protein n=1 Tax=Pseudomonas TaxID=286 RepID=UPI0016457623|nr:MULTISPECIES: hypothetical protein [Pseudomonas]MBC3197022.1 hypothetical protein [Pseudomonas poae]MDH0797566.1 hypothetical protein [Pseudomonas carnis]
MSEERYSMSQDEFVRSFINGWIVDARDGGLIVGRTHEEGHILMFQGTDVLGEFEHMGFVEGGEYIMSTDATAHHYSRLEEINSDKSPCDAEIYVTASSQLINTRAEPHDKFLVIHKQFIINRNATKRHFDELERLNRPHRYHRGRILDDDVIAAITEPGFVRY